MAEEVPPIPEAATGAHLVWNHPHINGVRGEDRPMAYPRVSGRSPATSDRLGSISLAAMAAALELEPGAVRSIGDTVRALRVAGRHEWLVRRWLRALSAHAVVELDGDVYRVLGEAPAADPDELVLLHARLRIPAEVARLHRRALVYLPELLSDELTAADLLAPDSTVLGALAGEGLSSLSGELDEAGAEYVRRTARARQDLVRVVELGCGAGRLTAAVLRESPGLINHYRFTDIGAQPLRAEGLDINEDFAAQGFADGTADMVVAGHTLHHAVNIGRALCRIRDLLVPDGELVLTTPVEDDPMALTSTHFLHSPAPGGEVVRGGTIFPGAHLWRTALRAAGFTPLEEMSVGVSSSARLHLFHAAREAM
ncbi:methyltransferase family protein [Lentzea atacamensis]|uniref:Methyltransferase family protein n=1 Tax=Lentzea atacamensis TaxID=531938 RepID=A0ABX9EBQ2_9PSEU|nr:methyltransferase domain-containing protein [Lentzea atacamensis]RAS66969.1 methyltransferase family protein [Lentzea atacamensis]